MTPLSTNVLCRLATLDGDWHELESKALRKANERKERQAKKDAAQESTAAGTSKDRKRPSEATDSHREAKRAHTENVAVAATVTPDNSNRDPVLEVPL